METDSTLMTETEEYSEMWDGGEAKGTTLRQNKTPDRH